jgi:hypothetical protein
MSRLTPEELGKRREEFAEDARRAFDRMMGADGRHGLVSFEEREVRACELGDGLTRRLLEEHLAADEAADPGAEVACPLCGHAVGCDAPGTAKAKMQKRKLLTRRGEVQYERAARRCPRCRRVFFPRGRAAGAGVGGV